MADHGDVRRMAADQDDAVLTAVDACQRLLQFAVNGPLTGNRPARRDRSAIAVNRGLGRLGDPRMAVEAEIIIRSEIDIGPAADQGFGPRNPLVYPEEWIGDAEVFRSFADH